MKITKGIMSGKDLTHYFINILSIDGKKELISNDFTNYRFRNGQNGEVLYENFQINQITLAKLSYTDGKLEKYIIDCNSKTEYYLILEIAKRLRLVDRLSSLDILLEKINGEYIEKIQFLKGPEKNSNFSYVIFINNHFFNCDNYFFLKNINSVMFKLNNDKIEKITKIEYYENFEKITKSLFDNTGSFRIKQNFLLSEGYGFIEKLKNTEGAFIQSLDSCFFIYNEDDKIKIINNKETITTFTTKKVKVIKNKKMKLFVYQRTNDDIGFFTVKNNKVNLISIHSLENLKFDYISRIDLYENNNLKISYKTSLYDSTTLASVFTFENNKFNFLCRYSEYEIDLAYIKDDKNEVLDQKGFSKCYIKDDKNGVYINLETQEIYNNKTKFKIINEFGLDILNSDLYEFNEFFSEPFLEEYGFDLKNGIVLKNTTVKNDKRNLFYISYTTNEVFELVNFFDNVKVFNLLINKYSNIIVENYLPRIASCFPHISTILTVLKADKHINWYRSKITKLYLEQYLNS